MSIRRHTITNIVGAVIPMFVLLVTVPLYLKTIGEVRYGVLALVWLVLGYFSFLEMGLGKATANHIARLRDATDKEREDVFWTALVLNAAFGIIAALILWSIGKYLLTNVLKIPVEFHDEVLGALPWIVATLPLALVSSVLIGALEGRTRFGVVNSLQVTSTTVFQIVPLIIAYIFSPSLAFVIPAAVLSRAMMNIPFLVACYFYVPFSHQPRFSRASVKSLLFYGGWVGLTGIFVPLLETIDKFLIGIVLSAQAVTHYTIPQQLVSKARIIPGSLARALFPRFSADDSMKADKLARQSIQAVLVVMTPLVVCGMFLVEPFLTIWVGQDISEKAAPLGELFFLGIWIGGLAEIPYSMLQGKGRPDIVAKLQVIQFVPFLLILYIAIQIWGIKGAAITWVVRHVIGAVLLFKFSGVTMQISRLLIMPAIIVIGSNLGANYVMGEVWYSRLGFLFLFLITTGLWLKNDKELAFLMNNIRRQKSIFR